MEPQNFKNILFEQNFNYEFEQHVHAIHSN